MDINNKVSAIVAGAAFACAPRYMRAVAQQAIENQIRLDMGKIEADSIGLSIRQYGVYKALPTGMISVSATDLQNFIDAIDEAVKK